MELYGWSLVHYMAVLAGWLAMLVPGVSSTPPADPTLNPAFSCAQLWWEDRGYVNELGYELTAEGWSLDTIDCT